MHSKENGRTRSCHARDGPHLQVEQFHQSHPQKPSPSNNIHRLSTLPETLWDERLYNEETDMSGQGFQPPPAPTEVTDIVLPVSSGITDDIVAKRTNLFHFIQDASSSLKRIWLFENGDVDAITFVTVQSPQKVLHLYQLMNPPSHSHLR